MLRMNNDVRESLIRAFSFKIKLSSRKLDRMWVRYDK